MGLEAPQFFPETFVSLSPRVPLEAVDAFSGDWIRIDFECSNEGLVSLAIIFRPATLACDSIEKAYTSLLQQLAAERIFKKCPQRPYNSREAPPAQNGVHRIRPKRFVDATPVAQNS